mmetsp:Transcript_45179/g.143938  ORF Transcript_45179/g.143938 Transcript_45179/m.143938 type:complete len:413 (-) Transcript_45179:73-1311(-)
MQLPGMQLPGMQLPGMQPPGLLPTAMQPAVPGPTVPAPAEAPSPAPAPAASAPEPAPMAPAAPEAPKEASTPPAQARGPEEAGAPTPAAASAPPRKAKQSEPDWLPSDVPCGLCGQASQTGEPHGVLCRRRRKNGTVAGCGQVVCWACMEGRLRSELGMVRTTREELESLEEGAWWMHERCMEPSDLRAYFGGDKELALARAAADHAEAEALAKASGAAVKGAAAAAVDPIEAVKEQIRQLSVKELKTYLDRRQVDRTGCVEKKELLAKALEVATNTPPEPPKGPAWMPVGATCRLCTKPVTKEFAGVICRRNRADGSVAGCGEGICWRCMKRAPRESFGQVRTTREEFQSLEEEAWWMHEACFEEGDYKDYFGESEPEEEKQRRENAQEPAAGHQAEPWSDLGSIMRRCEA